jgi:hypothetical protein
MPEMGLLDQIWWTPFGYVGFLNIRIWILDETNASWTKFKTIYHACPRRIGDFQFRDGSVRTKYDVKHCLVTIWKFEYDNSDEPLHHGPFKTIYHACSRRIDFQLEMGLLTKIWGNTVWLLIFLKNSNMTIWCNQTHHGLLSKTIYHAWFQYK